MDADRARLQLYVDDPALAILGTREQALQEGSLPILWWLVLGLKLSSSTGYFGNGAHDLIGVLYAIGPSAPTMELPPKYVRETIDGLAPLHREAW